MKAFWHNTPNPYITSENVRLSKPYTRWQQIVIAFFVILAFPFALVFYIIAKPLWGAFKLAGQAGFYLAERCFKPRLSDPAYKFQWLRCFLSHEAGNVPHINTSFRKMLYRMSGLHLGKGGFIGSGGILEDLNPENVVIEDNAVVSFGVTIVGHGPKPHKKKTKPTDKMVIIRHDSFVGARCLLIPGVEIGHHAMVGAGSVVTKDVPAGAIVAGCPAKVLYYRPGYQPAEAEQDK